MVQVLTGTYDDTRNYLVLHGAAPFPFVFLSPSLLSLSPSPPLSLSPSLPLSLPSGSPSILVWHCAPRLGAGKDERVRENSAGERERGRKFCIRERPGVVSSSLR
eukprot:2221819-Rhodomonas_salina.1